MTTTAFDDQFVTGKATAQLRKPYDTVAILRRNIADAEKEMQRQAERAESYADTLRSLAAYVGAGGYNADVVDADVFGAKIRWGIDEIMARTEKAEAELAKLAQQKPVAWMDAEGDTYKEEPPENWCPPYVPLYASFAHATHKGATHCDDCGLTWLDDGLNPLGCPYCKDVVPAPAVPDEWREVMTELAADVQAACDAEHPHRDQYPSVMRKYNNDMKIVEKARSLLQSADHSERNLEKVAPDCRTCANRGRINGLSQESYCDSCVYEGRGWRQNHFVDASKMVAASEEENEH